MDSVTNPWWLGGNISAGVPCGAEIAAKLGARLWISAHDGDKDVRGLVTGMLKTRRWRADEIECVLESRLNGGDKGSDAKAIGQNNPLLEKIKGARKGGGTEILRLTCGEEILVSGTGRLWRGAADDDDDGNENENNIRQNSGLITETRIAPPPIPIPMPKNPAGTTAGAHHHHQGKYYNNKKASAEAVELPQIQNAMSPKKHGIYKALRTKDLIMPSPKLTMERRDLTPTTTTITEATITRTVTTTARATRPGVGSPGTVTRPPNETVAADATAVLEPPADIVPLFKNKKEVGDEKPVAIAELPA